MDWVAVENSLRHDVAELRKQILAQRDQNGKEVQMMGTAAITIHALADAIAKGRRSP